MKRIDKLQSSRECSFTFTSANPDDMIGPEYRGDVTLDQRITDAKKRFRKTKVDRK